MYNSHYYSPSHQVFSVQGTSFLYNSYLSVNFSSTFVTTDLLNPCQLLALTVSGKESHTVEEPLPFTCFDICSYKLSMFLFLYWKGMKLPKPVWIICDLTDLSHIPISCCFFRLKSPNLVALCVELIPLFDCSCYCYLNFLQFYYILTGNGEPEWCSTLNMQIDPDYLLECLSTSKSDSSHCHMPSQS